MSSTSNDWSALPPELIETIARRLKIHADYIRFRAVCSTWRDAAPRIPTHLPTQLPWLMLSQSRLNSSRRAFFSIATNKLVHLNLPEASHRRRRCGSSHGWLTILEESPCIFLINPLSRERINLPPLSSFPNIVSFDFSNVGREYVLRYPEQGGIDGVYMSSLKDMRDSFIKKIVLSNSPSGGSHFVALAIINQTGDLAYCKSGQNSWNFIDKARFFCEDVTYLNGLFYAVDKYGEVAICDVSGDSPRVEFIKPARKLEGDMQYVVNAMGELLMVSRFLELALELEQLQLDIAYRTSEFQVFRLDSSGTKWERVMSLDDKVLFLGENSSVALLAADFPGCKGNRIYFTDDYSEGDYDGLSGGAHDLGVFNLEDGSIEPLPCYPRNSYSLLRLPPPIWVTPNPC